MLLKNDNSNGHRFWLRLALLCFLGLSGCGEAGGTETGNPTQPAMEPGSGDTDSDNDLTEMPPTLLDASIPDLQLWQICRLVAAKNFDGESCIIRIMMEDNASDEDVQQLIDTYAAHVAENSPPEILIFPSSDDFPDVLCALAQDERVASTEKFCRSTDTD